MPTARKPSQHCIPYENSVERSTGLSSSSSITILTARIAQAQLNDKRDPVTGPVTIWVDARPEADAGVRDTAPAVALATGHCRSCYPGPPADGNLVSLVGERITENQHVLIRDFSPVPERSDKLRHYLIGGCSAPLWRTTFLPPPVFPGEGWEGVCKSRSTEPHPTPGIPGEGKWPSHPLRARHKHELHPDREPRNLTSPGAEAHSLQPGGVSI